MHCYRITINITESINILLLSMFLYIKYVPPILLDSPEHSAGLPGIPQGLRMLIITHAPLLLAEGHEGTTRQPTKLFQISMNIQQSLAINSQIRLCYFFQKSLEN